MQRTDGSADVGEHRPDRRRARALLITALVGVTLVLSSCTPLLMVGDSITVGTKDATNSQLTPQGWSAEIDGQVGRTTDQGLQVIKAKRGSMEHFIVELGYNDAGNTTVYRDRLLAILDELRGAKQVWLVNLTESRSYYASANQIIAVAPLYYPNVKVVDWASVAKAHPEAIQSDGVHMTATGYQLLADTISAAVGQSPK